MIIIGKVIKDSDEGFSIGVDFTNREPIKSGATLSSGTVSAIDEMLDESASSDVLGSTTATIDGNIAKVRVQNGISGRDYLITFTCNFSNSDTHTATILMKVRDE